MERTFICCGTKLTIYPISVAMVKQEFVLKGWTLDGKLAQLPLKGITEFAGKKVTETAIIRPLSYEIRDYIPTRLKIEVNGREAVETISLG